MGWHFLVKLQNNDFPFFLSLSSCSEGSQLPFRELLHGEALVSLAKGQQGPEICHQ